MGALELSVPLPVTVPVQGSVELVGVSKRFVNVVAVDDVSLAVQPGEFVTLLGPSGCGKSTTLRLIAGLVSPDAGMIVIGGELMGSRPPYLRPVNTVFQSYALFPHLTVTQNVAYGLVMAGVDRRQRERRVAEALELVRLANVEERKPAALSGGQQQRVALARALVNQPAVLLLDEPLGALDLKLRQAMQHELKRIQAEAGATFLYVTHDQHEALTMADRIAVMNAGRVLQVGTPREMYDQPGTRFVADFIGENNLLDGVLRDTADSLGEVEVPGIGRLSGEIVAPIPLGTAATLAIRPERITVQPAPEPAPDGWQELDGTLTEIRYLGTHWRLVVTLDGGQPLVAQQQSGQAEVGLAHPGQRVRVCFRPREAVVVAG
jgi:spermidine/putrescine transport system ATP-binding protein